MTKKLLLADDSITIQKVVGIIFASEDYELVITDNGNSAFEKALEQRPDLVIADIAMPGRDGFELCRAIKSEPALAQTSVMLLPGAFDLFDQDRAAEVCADGWLTKPFESQALLDKVAELIAAEPLHPLTMDLASETIPAAAAEMSMASEPAAFDESDFGLDELDELVDIVEEEEESSDDIWNAVSFDDEELPAMEQDASQDDTFSAAGFEVSEEPQSEPAEDLSSFQAPEPSVERVQPPANDNFTFGDDMRTVEGDTLLNQDAGDGAEAREVDFSTYEKLESGFEFEEEFEDSSDLLPDLEEFVDDQDLAGTGAEDMVAFDNGSTPEGGGDFAFTVPPADGSEPAIDEPSAPPTDYSTEPPAEPFVAPEDDVLDLLEDEMVMDLAEEDMVEQQDSFVALERDVSPESVPVVETLELSSPVTEFNPPEDFDTQEPSGFEPEAAADLSSLPVQDEFAEQPVVDLEPDDIPSADLAPPLTAAPGEEEKEETVSPVARAEQQLRELSDSELQEIVSRVAGPTIERLAQDMLRQIIWEVVPDLAEALIKEEIRKIKSALAD